MIRTPLLGLYAQAFGADLGEAEKPIGEYRSLLEFFTRKLRDGARTWPDDPLAITAPADGKVNMAGTIRGERALQAKGVYYSLKQPLGTSGIHLSSFSQPDKHETVIPLQTTVAAAHFHDGSILGVDEDKDGVYVALIDPLTGKATAKTTLGKFNFAPTIALDKENSIAYISPGSDRGTGADDGTVFHLFTFSTLTGKQLRAPVLLHDTPDAQGPSGLTFVSGSTLLAFMPPLGGGWALVAIDAVTGAVSPTAALDNVPAMHVIAPGSSWLMRQPLPGPGASGAAGVASGLVLNAAFGAAPGGPMRMLAVDVACALSALLAPTTSGANCTIGNSPWPAKAGEQAPFDLALYQPPAAAGNTTAGR